MTHSQRTGFRKYMASGIFSAGLRTMLQPESFAILVPAEHPYAAGNLSQADSGA